MTAKEYLSQAQLLDRQINAKLRQIEMLRALTRQITPKYEGEPVSHTKNTSALQETIVKLIDAENELNSEIDRFVDLKLEIADVISEIPDATLRLILERHYLCFEPLSRVADEMYFTKRSIQGKHTQAVGMAEEILKKRNLI